MKKGLESQSYTGTQKFQTASGFFLISKFNKLIYSRDSFQRNSLKYPQDT